MKPIASLSLDLDDKWTYLKAHGDKSWESFPSYLDVVVPRVLNVLKTRQLAITFMVVGQDAAFSRNAAVLESIASSGHEIGNHSFNHDPWLHLYSEEQIEKDLEMAEEHIERVTGQRPAGFRGPAFSFSSAVLKVLKRRGYHYDASSFPTFVGPLARAYYFRTARFSEEERRDRQAMYGGLLAGIRPLNPYQWKLGARKLVEIPVTTMPIFRVPIHLSYVLYLSAFSLKLALSYFRFALTLCQARDVQVSLLLHPLDFLGREDVQDLSFFPAMRLPREQKLEVVSGVLNCLCAKYRVVTLKQHAQAAAQMSALPTLTPPFRYFTATEAGTGG
jgi:peptidoglycan-N-acetylglucosamine deacetylase